MASSDIHPLWGSLLKVPRRRPMRFSGPSSHPAAHTQPSVQTSSDPLWHLLPIPFPWLQVGDELGLQNCLSDASGRPPPHTHTLVCAQTDVAWAEAQKELRRRGGVGQSIQEIYH